MNRVQCNDTNRHRVTPLRHMNRERRHADLCHSRLESVPPTERYLTLGITVMPEWVLYATGVMMAGAGRARVKDKEAEVNKRCGCQEREREREQAHWWWRPRCHALYGLARGCLAQRSQIAPRERGTKRASCLLQRFERRTCHLRRLLRNRLHETHIC